MVYCPQTVTYPSNKHLIATRPKVELVNPTPDRYATRAPCFGSAVHLYIKPCSEYTTSRNNGVGA